jgi:hypothetical protein
VATPEEADEIYRQKSTYMDEITKGSTEQNGQPQEPTSEQASSGKAEGNKEKK